MKDEMAEGGGPHKCSGGGKVQELKSKVTGSLWVTSAHFCSALHLLTYCNDFHGVSRVPLGIALLRGLGDFHPVCTFGSPVLPLLEKPPPFGRSKAGAVFS